MSQESIVDKAKTPLFKLDDAELIAEFKRRTQESRILEEFEKLKRMLQIMADKKPEIAGGLNAAIGLVDLAAMKFGGANTTTLAELLKNIEPDTQSLKGHNTQQPPDRQDRRSNWEKANGYTARGVAPKAKAEPRVRTDGRGSMRDDNSKAGRIRLAALAMPSVYSWRIKDLPVANVASCDIHMQLKRMIEVDRTIAKVGKGLYQRVEKAACLSSDATQVKPEPSLPSLQAAN